jgi:hypothetical protein
MIFIDLLTKLQVTYGQGPCDDTLLNILAVCTDIEIRNALMKFQNAIEKFKHASDAIKRRTTDSRPVVVAFLLRIWGQLTPFQRQRLDDPSEWKWGDGIVMEFMYFIIPQVKKWEESTH